MKIAATTLMLALLLSACGQTGPLVLPGKEHKPIKPFAVLAPAAAPVAAPAPAAVTGDAAANDAAKPQDPAPDAASKKQPAATP